MRFRRENSGAAAVPPLAWHSGVEVRRADLRRATDRIKEAWRKFPPSPSLAEPALLRRRHRHQSMGKAIDAARVMRMLMLALLCACAQADPPRTRFDIAAQPVASALNEFARQADVTLIFSYDAVLDARSQPLQGMFSVDEGLARLLHGTPLSYRKSNDGSYLVCLPVDCSSTTHDTVSHAQSRANGAIAETGNRPVFIEASDTITRQNHFPGERIQP
jgi:hypothetical protein